MKWLPAALADVERLYEFLNQKSPDAARRAAQAILEGAESLRKNPAIGRPMGDDSGRREWFISFGAGSYVLRYKLETHDMAVIIRVWHSKEIRD